MEGYQVVEFDSLDRLIEEKEWTLLVGVLLYVVSSINNNSKYNELVKLELINVEYLGNYPAIGIKYLSKKSEDFEPTVHSVFTNVMENKSIKEFFDFLDKNSSKIRTLQESFGL